MEPSILQDDNKALAEQGNFEILKQSPMLGDNKFKLEISKFFFFLIGRFGVFSESLSFYGAC